MQRPYFYNNTMNTPEQFRPHYNQNYRFQSHPPYMQRQNQNYRIRAPFKPSHTNEEHWCETCDRGFHTADILEKHKQQHQKCNIDGCQFIAHPKVITKHIQMQHASGLYKKIAKLNNPEEIEKWREERKRKYPTKVNIEKKAAEIKEKIERGEKMGLNKERHRRQFNKGHPPNKTHPNENKQQNKSRQQTRSNLSKIRKPTLPKKPNVFPTADNLRKLKPFAGIQDIVMEASTTETLEDTHCNFDIEDDDGEQLPKPTVQNLQNVGNPKVCGALSSLMCDYDFSDDEIDNMIIEKPKSELNNSMDTKSDLHISSNSKSINVMNCSEVENQRNHISDDDAPEEVQIEKKCGIEPTDSIKTDDSIKIKKKVIEKKPIRNNFSKPKHKIPSTLLQKLLKREMQQERNIVLQCVRYVVKNNYFDKN